MDIVFGGVLNITMIVGSDLVWSERVVVDDTLDVVVGVTLVCEHLEHPDPMLPNTTGGKVNMCRWMMSGVMYLGDELTKHLPRLHNTIGVVENSSGWPQRVSEFVR